MQQTADGKPCKHPEPPSINDRDVTIRPPSLHEKLAARDENFIFNLKI